MGRDKGPPERKGGTVGTLRGEISFGEGDPCGAHILLHPKNSKPEPNLTDYLMT